MKYIAALGACCLAASFATPASAACWFNCTPSSADAERLARAHLGNPVAGTANIGLEFGLGQRSNVQLALQERRRIEPALTGQGRCDGFALGCSSLVLLAKHQLIDAVEWSICPSSPDWYCAIPIFSNSAKEAMKLHTIRKDGSTVAVKTADVRFVKVVRMRGDGQQAEVHYEIEIVPNVFGTTISPISPSRQERGFVTLKYSDGWRYAN